jgi:conjugal transfer pilus assembly protein TraK
MGRDWCRRGAGGTAFCRLRTTGGSCADLSGRAVPGVPGARRPECAGGRQWHGELRGLGQGPHPDQPAGDQFASVSKITTGIPTEDFKVVNEPVRGDIYISVPDGFVRPNLSFFGTTRKGFVYKFVCQVRGADAEQVFIANAAIKAEQARDWEVRSSPEDAAVRLAQAMYRSEVLDGFDIRQSVLEPVTVGKLEVQQVGEYRGADLKGLILRVRNSGRDAQVLNENMLAARGAVAFMTPVSELAAGQETAVYLIQANGGR